MAFRETLTVLHNYNFWINSQWNLRFHNPPPLFTDSALFPLPVRLSAQVSSGLWSLWDERDIANYQPSYCCYLQSPNNKKRTPFLPK